MAVCPSMGLTVICFRMVTPSGEAPSRGPFLWIFERVQGSNLEGSAKRSEALRARRACSPEGVRRRSRRIILVPQPWRCAPQWGSPPFASNWSRPSVKAPSWGPFLWILERVQGSNLEGSAKRSGALRARRACSPKGVRRGSRRIILVPRHSGVPLGLACPHFSIDGQPTMRCFWHGSGTIAPVSGNHSLRPCGVNLRPAEGGGLLARPLLGCAPRVASHRCPRLRYNPRAGIGNCREFYGLFSVQ